MDISTLNAVIEKLVAQRRDCERMRAYWRALREKDFAFEGHDDMWANKVVMTKQIIEMVQNMLDEELNYRAEEAA